jgi:hypothetical protein
VVRQRVTCSGVAFGKLFFASQPTTKRKWRTGEKVSPGHGAIPKANPQSKQFTLKICSCRTKGDAIPHLPKLLTVVFLD